MANRRFEIWQSSISCLQVAEQLRFGLSYAPRKEGDILDLVSTARDTVRSDNYRFFNNHAIANLCYSSIENLSALAEECLKNALGSPHKKENAQTLRLLAEGLESRSNQSLSLIDADKAVEYAEAAIAQIDRDNPDFPGMLTFLARFLLSRSTLRSNGLEKCDDSARAVKLYKKSLRLSISDSEAPRNRHGVAIEDAGQGTGEISPLSPVSDIYEIHIASVTTAIDPNV